MIKESIYASLFQRSLMTLLLMSGLGSLFLTSCDDNPTPPKAIVTVIELIPTDTIPTVKAVSNAKVWFTPPAGASQPDVVQFTQTPRLTDARGQVNYELKYESVIDYKVEHEVDGVKRFGFSTLIFSENEVYYDTIEIK
jgi:hypothetical protein